MNWGSLTEYQNNLNWFNKTVDSFKTKYGITQTEINNDVKKRDKLKLEFNKQKGIMEFVQ